MVKKEISLQDLRGLQEWIRLLQLQMNRLLEETPPSTLEWEELDTETGSPEELPPTLH